MKRTLQSHRPPGRVKELWAVIFRDAQGHEGIVRRDTIAGTQPWITDDVTLKDMMLELAKVASGYHEAELVRFIRG